MDSNLSYCRACDKLLRVSNGEDYCSDHRFINVLPDDRAALGHLAELFRIRGNTEKSMGKFEEASNSFAIASALRGRAERMNK